ncbi:MAG: hypothetical protein NTV88_02105 [Candidatus Micrarchaeota archaeon]|nr:hypothetical protein [Candidatus Micrarchaeota archaeon]
MIGKGIAESTPVTLAEVKKVLEHRQGTAGEFGFEQQTTLSYAQRFSHLSHADADHMQKEVLELGLPISTVVKIVDILPKNKAQILLIFAKDKAELTDKKMTELEAIIAKFGKKAKKLEPMKIEEVKPTEAPSEAPAEAEKKEGKEKKADDKEEKTD